MATTAHRRRRPAPVPSIGAGSIPSPLLLRFAPALLLGLALTVKLIVLFQLHDHPLLQPRGEMDSGVYLDLARRVAGGDLLAGNQVFFVSPFYVYFVGLILAVFGGSILAVQLAQVLLGTAAVALVAATTRLWYGARAGVLAAALAALTGYFTFNEILVLQSAVDPFLTALGLYLLARAWLQGNRLVYAAAGLTLGVHVLNRPNIGAWAAAAVVLTILGRTGTPAPRPPRWSAGAHRAVAAAALLAGLLVALAPVALRNRLVAGQFAPVSSHGGLNFYIGNNAEADGTYHLVSGITPSIAGQARDMRQVAARATGRTVTDTQASSWFYEQAWKWIRSAPGDAVALFGRKLLYVFNAVDLPLNFSYAFYRDDAGTLLRFLLIGPWLLLPLGLAGLWLRPALPPVNTGAGHMPAAWWRWASFVPVYAVSVAVFFVAGRYRLPLLVAFSVTSAAALMALWERWRARQARTLIASGACLLALALVTNVHLHLDDGRSGERTEMVLYEIDARQDQAARQLLDRTVAESPDPALVLYRAGQAYRERGDAGLAVPLLERAERRAPTQAAIALGLGEALLDAGHPAEAVRPLRAALSARMNVEVAAFDLARALAATGAKSEALAALGTIQETASLDPASLLAVGRLALDLGDPTLAERFLAVAAGRAPLDSATQETHGLALGLLGQRDAAIAALEAACRLDPANAAARLNLAVMYGEAGRLADAQRLGEDALRLRPDYARARQFLEALSQRR